MASVTSYSNSGQHKLVHPIKNNINSEIYSIGIETSFAGTSFDYKPKNIKLDSFHQKIKNIYQAFQQNKPYKQKTTSLIKELRKLIDDKEEGNELDDDFYTLYGMRDFSMILIDKHILKVYGQNIEWISNFAEAGKMSYEECKKIKALGLLVNK